MLAPGAGTAADGFCCYLLSTSLLRLFSLYTLEFTALSAFSNSVEPYVKQDSSTKHYMPVFFYFSSTFLIGRMVD